jgi:hypothetical protein
LDCGDLLLERMCAKHPQKKARKAPAVTRPEFPPSAH